jgi:hypothetical protein
MNLGSKQHPIDIHPYDLEELVNRFTINGVMSHDGPPEDPDLVQIDETWYRMTTSVPAKTKRIA